MFPSFVRIAVRLLSTTSIAHAFAGISFPDTVTSNTNATITITNDLNDGLTSFDSKYSTYRLYLSINPPNWSPGPSCYLVHASAINITEWIVQIPASVGPTGADYAIVALEFNPDTPSYLGNQASTFEYSSTFVLNNGSSEGWSQYELAGYTIGNPDYLPCSAYDCARSCSESHYPLNTQGVLNATEATYSCVANCTGTSFPSWDSVLTAENGTTTSTTTEFKSFTTTALPKSSSSSSSHSSSSATTTSAKTTTTAAHTTSASATTTKSSSAGSLVVVNYSLLFAGTMGIFAV